MSRPIGDHAAQRDLLAERYGRVPGRGGRGVLVAVVSGVLLVAVVVGWLIVRSAGGPGVDAELHSWDEPRDGVLTARVELRRDADLAVTCDLVAVDLRRIIVGQLDLEVPAGPDEHLVVSADIPLEGDGVVPELRGCRPASE
ncbi:DUF4307 domain-containing protein [Jiangella rhizosphaerae]|uniref:DUF4307 domain-containing protein n=1 Tax=Jiangella rhizosphaerae TaxID=2293569 RepID=A0A418KJI8_9ACTN|nr:DUF4307 domain-containing protein [Jiangella rhizosphaerae]RIQ14355.1 DUF4307 domain-containing protein [Jiangella rhizosphaerae]